MAQVVLAAKKTQRMIDTTTVAHRLEALAQLQQIDSQLDRIRQIRGGLPEEVRDLEDELEGLKTRIDRLEEESETSKIEVMQRNRIIDDSRAAIRKYEVQLNEVKNSREFEAINKEIELANLEILTSERKIGQFQELIDARQQKIDEVSTQYEDRKKDLELKQKELQTIVAETEKEEKQLLSDSAKAQKTIDARVLKSYQKIRFNMRNGLAVVTMDRGACGGCFAVIPPQRQHEIRARKRLIVCENCGRILVDEKYFTGEPEAEPVAAIA
jgi:uncharacterized protein